MVKFIPSIIAALSIIGLADAGFLTYNFYTADQLTCIISSGCDVVTKSVYSTVAGWPIAAFGSLFYLAVLLITIVRYYQPDSKWPAYWLLVISFLGFIFSVWLSYLQFFVLKAICFYCLLSASIVTIIFILSLSAAWLIGPRDQVQNI